MGIKIINLFAGPGAGKSTTAAGLFNLLKLKEYNAELVTEFAKDAVYECRNRTLENQYYVFGKQYHRIWRIVEYWKERGVEDGYIVTDSPFILSIFYQKNKNKTFKKFRKFVLEAFNEFDNYNFFLDRVKKYNPNGRLQTEDEAKQIDKKIESFLTENKIDFWRVIGGKDAAKGILEVLEKGLYQ